MKPTKLHNIKPNITCSMQAAYLHKYLLVHGAESIVWLSKSTITQFNVLTQQLFKQTCVKTNCNCIFTRAQARAGLFICTRCSCVALWARASKTMSAGSLELSGRPGNDSCRLRMRDSRRYNAIYNLTLHQLSFLYNATSLTLISHIFISFSS